MREPSVDNKNILSMNIKGYFLEFSYNFIDYSDGLVPKDFKPENESSGWSIRKAMKEWCKKHNIDDYIIYVNKSFVRDSHGNGVYELYVKEKKPMDKNKCWYCEKPLDECDGSCGRKYYEQEYKVKK